MNEGANSSRKRRRHRLSKWVIGSLLVYLSLAYLIVPAIWEVYEDRHPMFDDSPRVTTTADGHPGDPLNVSLIGGEAELAATMKVAGWFSAVRLGVVSDIEIGADTLLKRTDDDAPVSNLFLFGRKEDLAFEQPAKDNPRHRHHVRFWKLPDVADDGRSAWIGSASFDDSVGLSHTTGQVTHHIAADVDAERDYLADGLKQTSLLDDSVLVPEFHTTLQGKNGGGDPWQTDGALWLGTISDAGRGVSRND